MAGGDVVIIRDYKANLKTIDAVVKEIDVAPIQVLIEAVIITVDLEQNQNARRQLRGRRQPGPGPGDGRQRLDPRDRTRGSPRRSS